MQQQLPQHHHNSTVAQRAWWNSQRAMLLQDLDSSFALAGQMVLATIRALDYQGIALKTGGASFTGSLNSVQPAGVSSTVKMLDNDDGTYTASMSI